MRHLFASAAALTLAATLGTAGGGDKPEPSVTYAKTWDAAVEEAKLLNLPIVVHSHGFYWPPCNSVHGSVLQNKKYIAFAEENTVEVLVLDRLEEGIEKKDKRAATYKAKDIDGQEKDFLMGWPNLTVEDIAAMRGTKAGSYNNTGKIPYTAIVDPHTLEEMDKIQGGYGAGTLMDLVTAKKKELEKAHGKGVSRKALAKVKEADAEIRKALAAGNLAKALTDSAALQKKLAKEAPAIVEMANKTGVEVLEAAGKQLDEVEAMIGRGEKAEASKQLGPLSRALKGTTLEERALALFEKSKAE